MSYIISSRHIIQLSRAEFLEMVEARYGINGIPADARIMAMIQDTSIHRKCPGDQPIHVEWDTKEIVESFPEEDTTLPAPDMDDIPF